MLGACHGMDIAFFLHGGDEPLFGRNTFNDDNEPGRTSLSGAMMGYLANFAHTGDPARPTRASRRGSRGATTPVPRS